MGRRLWVGGVGRSLNRWSRCQNYVTRTTHPCHTSAINCSATPASAGKLIGEPFSMNLAIVTDAWLPQINGVVTTLLKTVEGVEAHGHRITVIHPGLFRTLPCPGYREIRLAVLPGRRLAKILDGGRPDAIHIATEGPLGLAARAYCLARRACFTTAFHTRFPEYVKVRVGVPAAATYRFLQWFHGPAHRLMVSTPSLAEELSRRGFCNVALWSRGVDSTLFRPLPKDHLAGPRPIYLYAGRVAVEKNLEAFLALDLEGSKYVVGDGPALASLRARHRDVQFTGYKTGEELVRHLAAADVFVFPRRTDTFGLVLIEALACGVPVAAYPVQGPADVVVNGVNGYLDEDLGKAARRALSLDPAACRASAERFSWAGSIRQFMENLCTRPG